MSPKSELQNLEAGPTPASTIFGARRRATIFGAEHGATLNRCEGDTQSSESERRFGIQGQRPHQYVILLMYYCTSVRHRTDERQAHMVPTSAVMPSGPQIGLCNRHPRTIPIHGATAEARHLTEVKGQIRGCGKSTWSRYTELSRK
jgi:hypothetical protein